VLLCPAVHVAFADRQRFFFELPPSARPPLVPPPFFSWSCRRDFGSRFLRVLELVLSVRCPSLPPQRRVRWSRGPFVLRSGPSRVFYLTNNFPSCLSQRFPPLHRVTKAVALLRFFSEIPFWPKCSFLSQVWFRPWVTPFPRVMYIIFSRLSSLVFPSPIRGDAPVLECTVLTAAGLFCDVFWSFLFSPLVSVLFFSFLRGVTVSPPTRRRFPWSVFCRDESPGSYSAIFVFRCSLSGQPSWFPWS